MEHSFTNLSPADFEDLARDLIGRTLGMRFEAFTSGPDGGIDGRHSESDRSTILQAKHFAGSPFAQLASAMKRERQAIEKLAPDRYLLVTSRGLTPANKSTLAGIIGPWLKRLEDVVGPRDLNALLRGHPDILKAHIKLWLSSSAILEQVVRAGAVAFNRFTRELIEAKVRVYAPNPSFAASRSILEAQHVIIISGPPGVGKTTLGEMLSYAYLAEGWQLVGIRSLEDGFASIDDRAQQIFLFDDFLGRVALDRKALAHNDSDLALFIGRVRRSPNARFILTTRAYIFEEARQVSEHLADRRLDVSKYVLDVGAYTRRIRARILYNHLLVAGTPKEFIASLFEGGHIPKIIDHRNFNPRIIEWMTDLSRVRNLEPHSYPRAFIKALDKPDELWDIPFRTHLTKRCQHLLFVIFCSPQYGVQIDTLRDHYNAVHSRLCERYREPQDLKDFEEALRTLEGSFITIQSQSVNFVNPSLRDYLSTYMNDATLLADLASAVPDTEWANAVWRHARLMSPRVQAEIAVAFRDIAERFPHLPTWRKGNDDVFGFDRHTVGLSIVDRIELLIDWGIASGMGRFGEIALTIARTSIGDLSSWRDGPDAVALVGKLRHEDHFGALPGASDIATELERGLALLLGRPMAIDDLEKIWSEAWEWDTFVSPDIIEAIQGAIQTEVDDVESYLSDVDSASTLEDYAKSLAKLAREASVSSRAVEAAIEKVRKRISDLEEETARAPSPDFGRARSENEEFNDQAVRDLFAPLVCR